MAQARKAVLAGVLGFLAFGCASGPFGVRPEIQGVGDGGEGREEITIQFEIFDEDLTRPSVAVEYFYGGSWREATITAAAVDGTETGVSRNVMVMDSAAADWTPCTVTWDTLADGVALAGSETVTIRLTPSDFDGVGQYVEYDVTVGNYYPTLDVDTAALSFEYVRGSGVNPAAQGVNVENTGPAGTTLEWSIDVGSLPVWLDAVPPSGSLDSGDPAVAVSVTTDPLGEALAASTYEADITFTGEDPFAELANGSPFQVHVTLTVREPRPEISIENSGGAPLTDLYFTAFESDGPQSESFWLRNSGELTTVLAWTATDNVTSPDWLSYAPDTGDAAEGAAPTEVPVTVDPGAVGAGTYTAVITISGSEKTTGELPTGGPQTVTVYLTVGTAAEIALSPTSFSFQAEEGGTDPASQTLSISNPGDAPLNWSVADNQGWLTLTNVSSPPCTVETDTVTVSVDISGLTADTYNATITVTAPGASNTPQTVGVTLTVSESGPSGLVAHWKFDESGATTTATDSTGNGNDGTLVNGPVWQPTGGKIGGALDFDGTNDSVNYGDFLNTVQLPLSVTAWVWSRDADEGPIFSSDEGGLYYRGLYLAIHGDGTVKLQYGDGSGNGPGSRRTCLSSVAVPTNSWVHVAGIARGPVDMSIYIDGIDVTGAYSGTGGDMVHSSDPAISGYRAPNGPLYYDGLLDDLRIYDRALSAAEVASLYQMAPVSIKSATADDPVPPNAPDDNDVLSNGDTLTIVFDTATNQPSGPDLTKADVDGLVSFENPLGLGYTGQWTAPDTLVITVVDATGGTLAIGDTVTITADGTDDLTDASGTRPPSTASASVSGDWGLLLTTGLVAHWEFDEAGGPTAADSSGNGNDGTLVNAPTWQPAGGKIGGALQFDGSDDYVDCGDIDAIDGATALTIAVWAKTGDLAADGVLLAKDAIDTDSAIYLFRDETGASTGRSDIYKTGVSDGTTEAFVEGASGASSDNDWHHVAMTFTADGLGLRLYVDGVEDTYSPSGTFGILSLKSTANSVCIGKAPVGVGKNWDGLIDDVRIYDRALTPAAIQALAGM